MYRYFVMDLKTRNGWTPIKVFRCPSVYPLLDQYGTISLRFRSVPQEVAEQTAIERQLDLEQRL